MKLTLLFWAIDIITLLAYPVVFLIDRLRHSSRLNSK
jgi:hypothetical protein